MYVEIALKGDNTGSVSTFAEYLDKDEKTDFFDQNNELVYYQDIVEGIDKNVKGLGAKESKFYGLSINPSDTELNFIANKNGSKVSSFDNLSDAEKEQIFSELKEYTHKVMDNYAKSFNRENVKGADDLIYYARIETERHYRHYHEEVKSGAKKVGDKKDGLNIHVHVVVSRKSRTGAKLSPNKNRNNSVFQQGDKKISRGFDYVGFYQNNMSDFATQTGFKTEKNIGKDPFSWQDKALYKGAGIAKGKAKNTVKQQAIQNLTQGVLKDEIKAISKTGEAVKAIKTVAMLNPKVLAKELLTKAVKAIVSEAVKTV